MCEPTASEEVVQAAAPVVAFQLTTHPATADPLSVKITVSLGESGTALAEGVIVAVKVTGWLTVEVLFVEEEAKTVLLVAGVTVCKRLELLPR